MPLSTAFRPAFLLPVLLLPLAAVSPGALAQVSQTPPPSQVQSQSHTQQQNSDAQNAAQAAASEAAARGTNQPPKDDGHPSYSFAETAVISDMQALRGTPDAQRGPAAIAVAKKIAALPPGINKLRFADNLAQLVTEGDPGQDAIQTVGATLAGALSQASVAQQPPDKNGNPSRPDAPYMDLAKLIRYEQVVIDPASRVLKNSEFIRAQAIVLADEADVQKADFALTDLSGKIWTLSSLRGKVVLVNFWTTTCGLCHKEMPDLQALSQRFAGQGLVVLSLFPEDRKKVAGYFNKQKVDYPILLDPGGAAMQSFHVDSLPRSFLFDRTGKLASEAIDIRTQNQFLAMLAPTGIQ